MKKPMIWMFCLIILGLNGCASMHDDQGWEHLGDPETHQDTTPYIFKHEH